MSDDLLDQVNEVLYDIEKKKEELETIEADLVFIIENLKRISKEMELRKRGQ